MILSFHFYFNWVFHQHNNRDFSVKQRLCRQHSAKIQLTMNRIFLFSKNLNLQKRFLSKKKLCSTTFLVAECKWLNFSCLGVKFRKSLKSGIIKLDDAYALSPRITPPDIIMLGFLYNSRKNLHLRKNRLLLIDPTSPQWMSIIFFFFKSTIVYLETGCCNIFFFLL